MTTIRTTLIAALLGIVASTSACRGPTPCAACDHAADDPPDHSLDMPSPELPDLPCGGADLMTDNLNCGMCGHECFSWYEETPYEAGACTGGVCSPSWTDCVPGGGPNPYWHTCAAICEALGHPCVPQGCSGYTAMLFGLLFGNGCGPDQQEPAATMMGSCDEPIPWDAVPMYAPHVMCCCDFQP